MKFIKIISLMLAIMFFAGNSTYAMPGEGEPGEVEQSSFSKIVRAIQEKIDANRELLGASEGKDIIAVLGNTGSGKSTTLNWLAGNSLKVGKFSCIVLENPEDPNALTIGGGSTSVTRFPESINIGGTEFFDLPGFRDTENGEMELVNVAFIKQILEKANSVKIMFVAGQDVTTADRGIHLKEFLDSLGVMFTGGYNDVLQNSSLFIMTKSDCTNDDLVEFLQRNIDKEKCPILYDWMENEKVFAVCKPQKVMIARGKFETFVVEEGKAEILEALEKCRGKKLCDLNWSSVYRPATVKTLTGVFKEILKQTFDKILPNSEKLDSISSCREAIDNVKGSGKGDFESFWDRFDKEIDEHSVIKLLKPLAKDLIAETNGEFKIWAQDMLQTSIFNFETRLKDLQGDFNISLAKRFSDIAVLQVEKLKEKVKFDCTDRDGIASKRKDLQEWSDFAIADSIMSTIKSDEEIKALVRKDEGSNSELYDKFLRDFEIKEEGGIKGFVKAVREAIIASENECTNLEKILSIQDEKERAIKAEEAQKAYNKQLEQQQKDFQERQNRLLAEQRKQHEEAMEQERKKLKQQQEEAKKAEADRNEQQRLLNVQIQELRDKNSALQAKLDDKWCVIC